MLTNEKGTIYKIENLVNGKVYVGQTSNFKARRRNHCNLLIRGSHYNRHLQKSWNKYGKSNFKIYILEQGNYSPQELDALEIKYIEKFKTHDPQYGYNKTYGGGGVRHTKETRLKVSRALSGKPKSEKHRRRLSEVKKKLAINTAERMSKETKMKWLKGKHDRMIGGGNPMYGKEITDEHRQKLSNASKGKNNPMYGKNIKDYMTTEAYEQWKKNVARPGALNGRAKKTIVIYKNKKYKFDYAELAIQHFKQLGEPITRNWFYKGVNKKFKDTFQYVGYEEE